MSENVKKTIVIFAAIFGLILLMFGVVIAKIVYIQTVEYDKWEKLSNANRSSSTSVIPAARGDIYDAEGRILASSIPLYNLHLDTRVEYLNQHGGEVFWQYVDSIAEGLSHILGDKTAADYRQKMVTAYRGKSTKTRDVRLTNTRVSYTQKKAIEQLPLIRRGYYKSGIYFTHINRRSKPFGSLGSRTIGTLHPQEGYGRPRHRRQGLFHRS